MSSSCRIFLAAILAAVAVSGAVFGETGSEVAGMPDQPAWRRPKGSLEPFTKIGEVTEPAFLDTDSGNRSWDYEVTSVGE